MIAPTPSAPPALHPFVMDKHSDVTLIRQRAQTQEDWAKFIRKLDIREQDE